MDSSFIVEFIISNFFCDISLGAHLRRVKYKAISVVRRMLLNRERGAGDSRPAQGTGKWKMEIKPNLNPNPISNLIPILCFVPIFQFPRLRH